MRVEKQHRIVPRQVKPTRFIEDVVDVDEKINPPITEVEISHLIKEYNIPREELHRLALFIYGIKTKNPISGRQDGVIPGVDLYVTKDENKANLVSQGHADEQIDLDSGRLAAFISRDEDTNYVWENGQILHNNNPTGLFAEQFPKDEFIGQFYVRTDDKGVHNRVVINPRPFCSSGCAWCARTYGDRSKLLHEQLDRRMTTPQDLIKELDENKPFQKLGGFKDMREINFVSGDFVPRENISQADYLIAFIKLAKKRGFNGKWYYSGHQITSENEIQRVKEEIGEGTICYTLEHLERRKELMPIKGKVELHEVLEILSRISRIMGPEHSQYYLISGLDRPETVMKWIEEHKDIALPQIHVFTPYSPSHYKLAKGNRLEQLENVLRIRSFILNQYGIGINSGSNRSLFPLGGYIK